MEMESCVPPGFRFHPTEEELVGYYLKRKINSLKIDLDVIVDVDLYKMEPWDIQATCNLGYDEQTEWYFFSHKDRKYPTGTRTNRATAAGFWKATGRDKAVLSKNKIIGMRKTLVFYRGRAPNGRKTDWIMHEYRLQTSQNAPTQEEGWVVCRAFKKPIPNQRQGYDHHQWNHHHHHHGYNPLHSSPSEACSSTSHQYLPPHHHHPHHIHNQDHNQLFISPSSQSFTDMMMMNSQLMVVHHHQDDHQLPQLLDSPNNAISASFGATTTNTMAAAGGNLKSNNLEELLVSQEANICGSSSSQMIFSSSLPMLMLDSESGGSIEADDGSCFLDCFADD
ncbi:unnamed protein product [Linum tenue]|uniref:NAC domain-containing protein n=1 Tax=Linum tenue TaxID=586396 RepID=A0AAV0IFP6_9ROSI|nr:unnamed protein product [Linum tenue]